MASQPPFRVPVPRPPGDPRFSNNYWHEDPGFGPDYRYFTHHLSHGIGMDGHEGAYFVRGNTTRIRPGMCFSDVPGIYIYGEMGIRHEDAIFITDNGAEAMTKWTLSPEESAVVQ